jgi:hypothetical protein
MPQLIATAVTAIRIRISIEGEKTIVGNGCNPVTVRFIRRLRNHQAEKNLTKGHGSTRKKGRHDLVVINDLLD